MQASSLQPSSNRFQTLVEEMSDSVTLPSSNALVESQLSVALTEIGRARQADVLMFRGNIDYDIDSLLRDHIESMPSRKSRLLFLLDTGGGLIEVAERIVTVLRKHYREVDFLIPDSAYSAGTILAMAGDAILMNYYSVLGPIDPQVYKEGVGWVPALGYLLKYEELISKSRDGKITNAEMAYLCDRFDPAELHRFEQAREQTISLLEEWLVQWKFKDWTTTETRKQEVSEEMKRARAAKIAKCLNDTERWHSHSRGIPMRVLTEELKLKIEDFDECPNGLGEKVQSYYKLLRDYLSRLRYNGVVHSSYDFTLTGSLA